MTQAEPISEGPVDHWHLCETCKCKIPCPDTHKKCEASGIGNAARVNHGGPFCERCRCGIMFLRYTIMRQENLFAVLAMLTEFEEQNPKVRPQIGNK